MNLDIYSDKVVMKITVLSEGDLLINVNSEPLWRAGKVVILYFIINRGKVLVSEQKILHMDMTRNQT
jgi:hypothetical protein